METVLPPNLHVSFLFREDYIFRHRCLGFYFNAQFLTLAVHRLGGEHKMRGFAASRVRPVPAAFFDRRSCRAPEEATKPLIESKDRALLCMQLQLYRRPVFSTCDTGSTRSASKQCDCLSGTVILALPSRGYFALSLGQFGPALVSRDPVEYEEP